MVIVSLLLSSCSTTRTLTRNELLYKGADINVTDKNFVTSIGLRKDLKKYAKPEPNNEFLGIMPFGLWFYNMIRDSVPDKGFRHWIKYGLGNPPVIFKYYYVDRSENDMQNFLYSKGYFDSRISTRRDVKGKKISIEYDVEARDQYIVTAYHYPPVTDTLAGMIDSSRTKSLIKKGQPYDFETLKNERIRINDFLRNNGYYQFAPDYLIFRLDSNYSKKTLDIYLDLKHDVPESAHWKYRLNKIYVHADYSLENADSISDTITYKDYEVIYHDPFLRSDALASAILFKKGQLYSFERYSSTLNKLMGLGVYKFANIRYDTVVSPADSTLLDAEIFLTRSVPKSLRLEVQAVTKSNDFAGPGISLSYRDRNIFHGAETFHIDLNGSYETQLGGKNTGLNTWQIGVNTGLEVPRFIFPFLDANRFLAKRYTPHTNIEAGYNLYNRPTYFTMNSADLSYGYNWRETISKSHAFKLFNLNYSNLSKSSAAFDSLLNSNPLVRESFNEQFVLSLNYRYTYNNQLAGKKSLNTYLQIDNELAGNTLNALERIAGMKSKGEQNATLLGLPYSQYVRSVGDLRLYVNSLNYNKLASRFLVGIGLPYGNSNALPYRKQFYIGGPNSLRAFRYRSVGPGTFFPDSLYSGSVFDQTGEIKLEGNLEFRFSIYKMVKGALFFDAGNVWLISVDNLRPGGQFRWSRFINEIAMGTGFGLRFDASFFVLRFDLGIPVRKPWLPGKEQWTLRNFDLSSPTWRRDNLVLNVAIGYPF